MKLNLSPVRRDDTLNVSVAGDVLTINNQAFDFSALPEGATLPADAVDSEWITGPVSRVAGVIELTIVAPHGVNASEAARFPQPITVINGQVELPL